MFTGIITDIGTVASATARAGADLRLEIETAYDLASVAIGASISCSGVCLTVVSKSGTRFCVDVSGETISRTAQAMWQPGARLNLERALKVGDELGGHIVTGHIDAVGTIIASDKSDGSLALVVEAPPSLVPFIAAKGSVCVDGVSLTVNSVADTPAGAHFTLNISPHTAEWTNLGGSAVGRQVNLEIDVLARYLQRMEQARHHTVI